MNDWEFMYPENANVSQDEIDAICVHPTALVSQRAVLHKGVRIGPHCIVGPDVTLESGVQLASYVVVGGRTVVGKGTHVFPFATLGTRPQDLKYRGEPTELLIGQRNTIREYVNIATGTADGAEKTVIGSDNFIMAFTHIAHDCHVGDGCVLTNAVSLGGHVQIGNEAVLGGMSGVHQFARVGDLAMIAGGSMVFRDVPPFSLAQGYGAEINWLNFVGLRKARMSPQRISEIKTMFHLLYKEGLTLKDAITRIEQEIPPSPQKTTFVNFLKTSKRGICR